MRLSNLISDSLTITLRHRALWVFGLFAAAGGGASGSAGDAGTPGDSAGATADVVGGAASGLAQVAGEVGAFLASHLPLVMGGAAAVALGVLALHVLSEGALIEDVGRIKRAPGEPFGLLRGFRLGLGHFGGVLKVKVLALGLGLALAALVAAPLALGGLGVIPAAAGIALGAVAGLGAIPAGITLYLAYKLGLRAAVLENRGALDALRRGRRLLHGRLLDGLKLVLVAGVGRAAASLLVLPVILPIALCGLLGWALGGLVGAVVAALALVLPVALLLAALQGTWHSSLWTLGYLAAVEEGR
jgi:hypothetical protein